HVTGVQTCALPISHRRQNVRGFAAHKLSDERVSASVSAKYCSAVQSTSIASPSSSSFTSVQTRRARRPFPSHHHHVVIASGRQLRAELVEREVERRRADVEKRDAAGPADHPAAGR